LTRFPRLARELLSVWIIDHISIVHKKNARDLMLQSGYGGNRGKARRASRAQGTLLLDDQLCFALYAASRAVTQRYRPLLDRVGITYPQYLVMLVLWEHDTTTVKGLADALQLDYGALSPLLKRLATATWSVAAAPMTNDRSR
jgi:hypothetical protein